MLNKIYFSVIVPVYNKFPHLDRSISSILNQTYPYFELIIIDDGSTDGSSEKLSSFKDQRIKFFKRENPGAGGYAARNLGIQEASHDWICFLDADDEWESNLLEHLQHVLYQNPKIEILSWGYYIVKYNGKMVDPYSHKNKRLVSKPFFLIDYFLFPRPIWTGAVALKKELLITAGMFPEGKCSRGGDVDTWIRCLIKSNGNLWINKIMSYYYTDSVNMVTKTIDEDIPYCFNTVQELYKVTDDSKLKVAIVRFKSSKLFSVIARQIRIGKGINYELLFKMDIKSFRFIKYSLQLHFQFFKFAVFKKY